jgi:hypothetical protein
MPLNSGYIYMHKAFTFTASVNTMKHLYLVIFNLFIINVTMQAQTNSIAGVYNLEGVREMASGFQLHADSTFEFYFSYGALDRYGGGKWNFINNKIILNSNPYPGNDFKMISSSHTGSDYITINIQEKNTMLLPFVYAFGNTLKEGEYPVKADSHGMIKLPAANTDTLHLLFEFTTERLSSFAIDTKKQNNFTFAFEPWLVEVFFTNFELTVKENKLEGKHPLLEKDSCTYLKE